MIEWLQNNETVLWWMALGSVVTFVVSLVAVYWLLVLLPADYFRREKSRPSLWAQQHPALRWTLRIVKNVIGVVLLVAGILMLFLPGQGLLAILVAVMLLNFPGKYRFERWLVTRRGVRRPIDWLRARAGRPPLNLER